MTLVNILFGGESFVVPDGWDFWTFRGMVFRRAGESIQQRVEGVWISVHTERIDREAA